MSPIYRKVNVGMCLFIWRWVCLPFMVLSWRVEELTETCLIVDMFSIPAISVAYCQAMTVGYHGRSSPHSQNNYAKVKQTWISWSYSIIRGVGQEIKWPNLNCKQTQKAWLVKEVSVGAKCFMSSRCTRRRPRWSRRRGRDPWTWKLLQAPNTLAPLEPILDSRWNLNTTAETATFNQK